MKNIIKINKILFLSIIFILSSCSKDFIELEPRGTTLETNYYKTEDEIFNGVVAVYDVLQWGGTDGWTMKLGLLDAASDDCYAGGSDASDQPSWVAYDKFTLDPFIGPQKGFWDKNYAGVYRANLILQKMDELTDMDETKKARWTAEVKFLRAYFYFDLVRFFGNVPLIKNVLSADEIYKQKQSTPDEIYAFIEQDLKDAKNTFELPATVPPSEYGRITKGAVNALLGKVILFENDESRVLEAASLFDEVINSGNYALEEDFGNIFNPDNEFGKESIFEISHSDNQRGGWESFANGTEGNYTVQFCGMRDYVGPTYSPGWSFCPITEKLANAMKNDPRFEYTIIDGNQLRAQGASYTEGYQNTNYFIRKYAPLADYRALDGEPAINWKNNIIEIRLADVLLMAAECYAKAGNTSQAKTYLNMVRQRVALQPVTTSNQEKLLGFIYHERQLELATEGHRFFDLIRTGKAVEELGDQGFTPNKNEVLPIPQSEIDITQGNLVQNPGY